MNLCSRVPHASKKSALDKHRQTERALCTFMKGFEGRTALLRASGGVGEALPRDAGMSIDLGNEKKLNDILGESRQEPTHISALLFWVAQRGLKSSLRISPVCAIP